MAVDSGGGERRERGEGGRGAGGRGAGAQVWLFSPLIKQAGIDFFLLFIFLIFALGSIYSRVKGERGEEGAWGG